MSIENTGIHSGGYFETFTPSDTGNFEGSPIRGVILEEDGPIKIKDLAGNEVTIPNLVGGVVHPIQAVKIFATGTTATSVTLVR